MAEKEEVAPQITDAISQANVTGLGLTPSFALAQSNLAFAQSQGVLFANMISDQQQQSTSGAAAIVKCVQELLGDDTPRAPSSNNERSSVLRSSVRSSSNETTTEKNRGRG